MLASETLLRALSAFTECRAPADKSGRGLLHHNRRLAFRIAATRVRFLRNEDISEERGGELS